jgi:hypothetical protein
MSGGRFVPLECALLRIRLLEGYVRKSGRSFPLGQPHRHMRGGTDHPWAAIDVAVIPDERFQIQHKFFGKHG